ncbi:polysaccharide biosynthesis tyrosine autokinase [Desulfobacula sp.]|uniref:polysaccharide biosynthesis tyrosine autokinase n=1 Tax=Desulfobacula sp. TaxID=2593537 RepID=UPI0025BE87EC|nr:polysaccharide biosynthesis tyrosine autokinase [Desulfobacula sp.]
MGKIFKALEKSQQSVEKVQRVVDNFDAEIISKSHGQKRYDPAHGPVDDMATHDNEIENITINIDPMLVTGLKPHSIEAEQFRQLKNNILFPEKGNPPRCIMITATSPGEGKSFVAANLAISIAQNIDEHVLLVDCDLRSPSIDSMFGFNNIQGLSEYLSKAKPLSSLLVKTFLNKLTLLPAGTIPTNPSELLSSEQMRRLIHEVKLRYTDRYIIIDTPPPYLTSETSAISRQVDGIIIVIQQGKTRKKDVLDLIDIYGKEKIIGVVYNFAKKRVGYGYGKYGYGKYGYGVKNA